MSAWWLGAPLVAILGLAGAAGAAAPAIPPDGRAGSCYTYYPNDPGHPFLPLIRSAGGRWDRFDFSWPVLQPLPQRWEFGSHDRLVADLRAADMEIVGILLWTPDWAASNGAGSGLTLAPVTRPRGWYAPVRRSLPSAPAQAGWARPPRNLELPWDHPENYWGQYVRAVVTRYRGAVKAWELWNEPEWDFFWTGTESDYAHLLRVGYRAVKSACADCRVLFGGLHYWDDPTFYERVLDILNDEPDAAQNNYYFDVMSVHLYSRSSSVYDVAGAIRNRMRALASDHPVWLTETGVPVWDDAAVDPDPTPYRWAARQTEAAAFVLQSYANAWAAGIERYFHFRTNDADMTEFFGLMRNDLSPRPSYSAYKVATTYLITPTMTTSMDYSNGIRRVTLWGTPRGKVSVLWNTRPVALAFAYPATLPTATRVDSRGDRQPLQAADGSYVIELPGATANMGANSSDYIIGGDPCLVVEADTVPPDATVHPLPPISQPPAIDVSWSGVDDAAGVWAYDVQVRRGVDAPWTSWRTFDTATAAAFQPVLADETYCFRARAWDRAGNRGPWPAEPQACTWTGPWQTTVRIAMPAAWR